MRVKRVTAVLFIPEVEPCVEFWTRLGFAKAVEVPAGSKLGFVSLTKDGTEVMYQSYASLDKDVSGVASAARRGPTFLYVEVDDLDAAKAAVRGAEVYLSERTTFYGALEIGVKDPAGHHVTFAQFGTQAGG
jgi:uncharacterized glyoxalase superfamily protein PhnB